jgi:hypothetical protein
MTYRAKVTANLKAIPPKKRESKIRKTVWGVGLAILAGVIAKYRPDWPWQVPVVTGAFGMLLASGEILMHPFKLIVAGIRDVVNALKGGSDAGG